MLKNKLNYKLINFTALMLFLYIGLSNISLWIGVLNKIVSVLMPFLIAFVFAYALSPVVRWLENKNIKHSLAVTIVVIAIVLFLTSLVAITLPLVYDQLSSLYKIVTELTNDMQGSITIGNFTFEIDKYIEVYLEKLGDFVSDGAIDFVFSSVGVIGTFIVGFISWIYFLFDMQKIRKLLKDTLKNTRKKTYNYLKCLDVEIGNYLRGLVIFMIIQLFEYSLVFFLVGHPNWLLLGILASVTTVIPYFGGLVTNIIAVITGSVVSTQVFIGTIIICLIFPQVDGYFISPKIYGKTNNINPLITIMAVSIGGSLAGVLGIIAALPIYLLIRSTYHFFKNDIKEVSKKLKED